MTRTNLILVCTALLLLLAACSRTAGPSDNAILTQEQSRMIAEHYLVGLDEYRLYNGTGLQLLAVEPLLCASCWRFTYEFDIDSLQAPGNISGFQVDVQVRNGVVMDATARILEAAEFTPVEVLNQSCRVNSQCEVPFTYLVRSNCPYASKCLQGQCTVVCPNLRAQDRAVEAAYDYVVRLDAYKNYDGRNPWVTGISDAGCPTCFAVNMTFTLQSEKNRSRAEQGNVQLYINRTTILDAVYWQGGPEVLSMAACELRGGAPRTLPCVDQLGILERDEGHCCKIAPVTPS